MILVVLSCERFSFDELSNNKFESITSGWTFLFLFLSIFLFLPAFWPWLTLFLAPVPNSSPKCLHRNRIKENSHKNMKQRAYYYAFRMPYRRLNCSSACCVAPPLRFHTHSIEPAEQTDTGQVSQVETKNNISKEPDSVRTS